jgi:hypothetical protein
MKKIALVFASIIIIAGMFTITSCDKTNTTKPTVTLTGAATMITSLNAAFTDPGATAKDSKDKELTVTVTVVPAFNKDLAGDYVYTYSATDADGNVGEATRTVTVRNDSYGLAGSYNASDDYDNNGTADYTWTETLTASSTINNQMVFSKFAYYTGCALKINVSGNTLSYANPQQFLCGAGADQQNRTFSAITGDITSGTTIVVFYHEVDADAFTTDGKDTFVKI